MQTSVELKEAKVKWDKITRDRKLRDRALRREIAMLDYNTGISCATEKGLEDGIARGKAAMQKEVLKKMLHEKCDIELICKVTGLSKSDIKNIIEENDPSVLNFFD